MERNIYDLMNETTVDLNNYKAEEMTMLEQKRAMKAVNAESKNTKKGFGQYKKYVAVASVAVLSLGVVGAIPTIASTNPTAYKIANMLGIEKNLDDYTTAVNKVVSDKGISIGLGEVLYDKEGDVLIVTNYLSVQDGIMQTDQLGSNYSMHEDIYINGKHLNTSSSTEVKAIDEKTVAFVTTYNTKEDLTGKNDITIKIKQVFVDGKEYRGNWDMAFSVDGTQFSAATQTVDINHTLAGVNGDIELVKYVTSPIGESIYYTQEDSQFIELRGTDNTGNEVKFVLAGGAYEELFKLELAPGYQISEDATSLTLELYEQAMIPLENPEVTVDENGNESTKIADIAEGFEATGEVVTIQLP